MSILYLKPYTKLKNEELLDLAYEKIEIIRKASVNKDSELFKQEINSFNEIVKEIKKRKLGADEYNLLKQIFIT